MAAELPYLFNADLSLLGVCGTTPLDPIEDPGCPNGDHPPSGRFDEPRAIAIDAYGNEYVASYAGDGTKGRIDVFDDEGYFLTEILNSKGPLSLAVDKMGNLFVSQGDGTLVRYTPTAYDPGAGEVEYADPPTTIGAIDTLSGGLAIDVSNDHLFVVDDPSIREYGSAEDGNKLVSTFTPGGVTWKKWIAIDAERRRMFVSSCKSSFFECGVFVYEADPPYAQIEDVFGEGTPAGKFSSLKGWLSIAVDEESGHFFIDDLGQTKSVYEFDEEFDYAAKFENGAFKGGNALQIAVSNSPLNPTAKNRRHLFVPVMLQAGNALAFSPPALALPSIDSIAPAGISETEAELRVRINPGGGLTDYRFEYVSEEEFAKTAWANAVLVGQGSLAGSKVASEANAIAAGLAPGTAYRFRVVAENQAGEGEAEAGFSTYDDAPTGAACANQALRIGPSSILPDCRAYELVTPPDTNGRPPTGVSFSGDRFPTVEASPSGGAVSFMTEGGSLPGTEGTGGFHGDLYRSTRTASGWSTAGAGPSGTETTLPITGSTSPDQGYAFWVAGGRGSAVVVEGQQARYLRYPDGHSELIGRGSLGSDPTARGTLLSEGGAHVVFETVSVSPTQAIKLEPNAPPTGTETVYDRTIDPATGAEQTHVVSLLPGNITPPAGQNAEYIGASPDGEGIAFEIGDTLYLRVGNQTTHEIATGVEFAGVAQGASRIFYVEGGDLLAFDTGTEEVVEFSQSGDVTPVNVAPQGTRAYFVSPSVLSGAGENPNGEVAQPGAQNLYLSEEGQVSFVATVTDRDVVGEIDSVNHLPKDGLGLWTEALGFGQPAKDPSRVNPAGTVLLFQSRAELSGYDPGGAPMVYRYDSLGGRLHCLSCIPTGAAAGGGASLQSYAALQATGPPFSASGFVPNLTPGGRRAFFESTEALVSYDSDGVQDIYEWEDQGVGSCTRPGGCVYLISSGVSEAPNYLYGHSTSGEDVFFTTADVLVAGDNDTVSIYDAKAGGGFPAPQPTICPDLDTCQGQVAPGPSFPTPTSEGLGRAAEPRAPKPCPKGKRKVRRAGKVRCVKKPRKRGSRKAATRRGAAR